MPVSYYKVACVFFGFALLIITSFRASAADCQTTADNVWDCGIPNPSDDLTVNHIVTIADNFDPTGNIIINSGGFLTITGTSLIKNCSIIIEESGTLAIQGNATFSTNSSVTCKGEMIFNNLMTVIETSANFVIQGGTVSLDGDILVTTGAKFDVGVGSTLFTHNSIEFNSDNITIDGLVDIEGNFTNNKHINGTGTINYVGSCDGSGTINGIGSSTYCGAGSIDMDSLGANDCDNDIDNPVISNIPEDITIYTSAASCSATADWTEPLAIDNCTLQSFTSTHSPGSSFPIGNTNVSYTAVDANSNAVSASFIVTVLDTIAPVFSSFPTDLTVSTDDDACSTIVSWTAPIALDNCSASLSSDFSPGEQFPIGTTKVSYTAEDPSGNLVTQSFDIVVENTHTPTFKDCPSDTLIYVGKDQCDIAIEWTSPIISGCEVTSSATHASGDVFAIGAHEVIYQASTGEGNTGTCSFKINVIDTIPPDFSYFPSDTVVYVAENTCEAKVSWNEPVAYAGCGEISVQFSHSQNEVFDLGENIISYTLTDVYGNSRQKSFKLSVLDTFPPAFDFCPTGFAVTHIDTISNLSTIEWEVPKFSSDCGEIQVISNFNPGDQFEPGATTIEYIATDVSGNTAICTFDVASYPNQPPVSEDLFISGKGGTDITFCLEASDPEGDNISIKSIRYDNSISTLEITDETSFCFLYRAENEYEGLDEIEIVLVDDGDPNRATVVLISLDIEENILIEAGSAMTVNGDNINDNWQIENIDLYPQNSVRVFDRWGGLIFNISGYNNESAVWDGKNKSGKFVSAGTYFYTIDLGNGSKINSGAIEVLR